LWAENNGISCSTITRAPEGSAKTTPDKLFENHKDKFFYPELRGVELSSLKLLVVPISMQHHHSTVVAIIPPAGQTTGHMLHFDTVITDEKTGKRYHDSESLVSLLGGFLARKLACERAVTAAEGRSDNASLPLQPSAALIAFKAIIVKDVPVQPPFSNACGPATQFIIKRLAEQSDLRGLQAFSQSLAAESSAGGPDKNGSLLHLCGLKDLCSFHYEENRAVIYGSYMEFMSHNA
jgi:hypothetical protein